MTKVYPVSTFDKEEEDKMEELNINGNVSNEMKVQIAELIENVRENLVKEKFIPEFEMEIRLNKEEPIVYRLRRFSIPENETIGEIIDNLLDKGIMQAQQI